MKTRTIYLAAFLCTILCFQAHGQEKNKKVTDVNGREKLLGQVDKQAFLKDSFASWFAPQFEGFEVDQKEVKKFKKKLKKYDIIAFMGTWCGDSKREVPRFYKVLEAADFPMNQLKMVTVDYIKPNYKKSPDGEEEGLNIVKVPTFIFLKKGKEVNRIIESPVTSLEKDMTAIVIQKDYVPNHSEVRLVPMD